MSRAAAASVLTVLAGAAVADAPAHAVPAGIAVRPRVDRPPTVSAASVRDSIGVNVHMSYDDTGYADAAQVASLVTGLGVRHVRDGLQPDRPDQVAALDRLGRAGVHSTLIISGAPTASQVAELHTLAPYLDGVEATNEDDCSGDPSWTQDLRRTERLLDSTLAADPRLAAVPRLGPSFCQPQSVAAFGRLDSGATVVNVHDYSPGSAPELALESRVPATRRTQDPSAPVQITETGYQNASAATGWNAPVPEGAAADYLLRSLLDARRLGVARTFVYELLDEKPDPALTNPEEHFGLVRADGTPKPAYTAVRNLLADLPATGGSSGPAPRSPATVLGGGALLRSLAIADPSGGGETVALWLAEPDDANPATVSVRLPAQYRATLRRPSRGNRPVVLGTGSQFTVGVGPAVTLLHLAPVPGRAANWTCTAGAYRAAQSGARVVSHLRALGAVPDATVPDDLTAGAAVTAAGQQVHVPVPGLPAPWTIAIWERTAPGSASYAPFLRVSGAAGAVMRTYDLTDDVPSHDELSAYGAPPPGSAYGVETWAQAQPGTWHLLSLSNDGTTATFAVDGVTVGNASSGPLTVSGLDVGDLGGGFRGSLADLAVFPSVLAGTRLTSLATTDAISCRAGG